MRDKIFRGRRVFLDAGGSTRYPAVYWPEHSLAGSRGCVPIHRVIGLEKFGEIPDGFHIHHKDGDVWNWNPENLELLSPREHASLHVKRLRSQEFICPWCNTNFTLKGKKLQKAIQNRNKGKAGPFCGRSCAGKYGAAIQNGKVEPFEVERIDPSYYIKAD